MTKFNEDLYLSEHALDRYNWEAAQGNWFLVMGRAEGNLVVTQKKTDFSPLPSVFQRLFADDMAAALNKDLAHDGGWVVLLTHPPQSEFIMPEQDYGRFCFLWMDADGDIQFTVENDEPLWVVLSCGKIHWEEQAQQAWENWHHMMREVLDPAENQLSTRVN